MKRLVLSEVNAPVENPEMATAQISAGHQYRSHFILAVRSSATADCLATDDQRERSIRVCNWELRA
jgi:hypothetical protein